MQVFYFVFNNNKPVLGDKKHASVLVVDNPSRIYTGIKVNLVKRVIN